MWKAFEDLSQEVLVSAQDLSGTSGGGKAETGWADGTSRKDQHRRNPIWHQNPPGVARGVHDTAGWQGAGLQRGHQPVQVARGASPAVPLKG